MKPGVRVSGERNGEKDKSTGEKDADGVQRVTSRSDCATDCSSTCRLRGRCYAFNVAPDPEHVSITRREHARNRLKRWTRFWKEATKGVLDARDWKRQHHEALLTATANRNRWDGSVRSLRTQLTEDANPPLEGEIKTAEQRRDKAQARIEKLTKAIASENDNIASVKRRAKRAFTKRRHFLKRSRFFAVKVRHFKELREQREKRQPKFEPWMANGANYQDASGGAKAFIARAVVLHGLTCTSMARTYVPTGGSTSSYHLVWNGGRAGDAAGSQDRMEACQLSEYERGRGLPGQLEMFGPVNERCLKLGNSLTLAEGDPLENLHDSHVHCAEEDSAVDAALNRKQGET
jgi:hypothetical protein